MSDYESNIKIIEKIVSEIGVDEFKKALSEINRRNVLERQHNCLHDWKLSQIAGDGYGCFKCGSWKPED